MRFKATEADLRALLRLAELDEKLLQLDVSHPSSKKAAESIELKRAVLEGRMHQDLAKRYESLLRLGRRPAISAAQDGYCSGCHMRLPMQFEQEVSRRPSQVFTCPNCKRMLYHASHAAAGHPEGGSAR